MQPRWTLGVVTMIVIVASFVVVACGGGGGSSVQPSQDGPGPGASAVPADTSPPVAGESAVPAVEGGYGSAVLTVDDVRTEYAIGDFGCGPLTSARGHEYVRAHGDANAVSDAGFSVQFPMVLEDWSAQEGDTVTVTAPGHRWEAFGWSHGQFEGFQGPRVDRLEVALVGELGSFHATGTFLVMDTHDIGYDEESTDLVVGSAG
jgi:hypothetical protein